MPERLEVYQCKLCSNIVEVLRGGGGSLSCCETPMTHLKENTVDAAVEKHVPVVEAVDGGYVVKVGDVPHPMGADHYIEWIELSTEDNTFVQRQMLTPSSEPEATFKTNAAKVVARAYCNLHGLWKD